MEGEREDLIRSEESFSGHINEADPQPIQNNNKLVWEKILFIVSVFAVVTSATILVVTLPLYLEAVNIKGDAYSSVLFICTVATVLFGAICIGGQLLWPGPRRSFGPPLPAIRLLRAGVLNALSGLVFIYALDRKRVLCHLQDPIMGVILVFSLVFYFFFCGKMMGLQKIFCATTIIVGLFISVDYQLCDEFRCHGNSRESQSEEDAGRWSWRTHAFWTLAYIASLAVWTLNFTLLEGEVYRSYCIHSSYATSSMSSTSLLSTISRLVANKDRLRRGNADTCRSPLLASTSDCNGTALEGIAELNTDNAPHRIDGIQIQDNREANQCHGCKLPSPPALAFWIHVVTMVIILCLCWTDMLPYLGKGSSAAESWEFIKSGLSCHFGGGESCRMVAQRGWAFALAYTVFFLTSSVLLVLSESSVLTVATPTAALPLASLFWSLMHDGGIAGSEPGLHWSPTVTGELICALLGLPVVFVGLGLFCKSHWAEKAQNNLCRRFPPSSISTRRIVIPEDKQGESLDA